jgi:aminopeptidase
MNESELSQSLDKYADVAIKIGVNLQKGQRLSIITDTESLVLVRRLVISAYKAGAKFVDVLINDRPLERIRFEHAQPESLTEAPEWLLARLLEYWAHGEASLIVFSATPDLFAGIDPELAAANQKAEAEKYDSAWQYIMRDEVNWSVVSAVSAAWAQKVFPEMPLEQAQARLWEEIFETCRIDSPDPVQAWEEHIQALDRRSEFLNNKCYTAFHYKAPGTDFTLGLPQGQRWASCRMKAGNGIEFVANLPTEEVFSMPHRERAEGFVTASRPLNHNGTLIDGFTVSFENGHVTNVTAKTGEVALRRLIETDEGAGRLGEVALVPYSSPISQRNRMFFSTLFDENAASHTALGDAYRYSLRGGREMSDEEFTANGGNRSLIHADFMIGSGEMDIDGLCEDGTREPVMRQGEWAFEI